MSPHGILTEPSLSPHDRKGREGKGREKEGKNVAHASVSNWWRHVRRASATLTTLTAHRCMRGDSWA